MMRGDEPAATTASDGTERDRITDLKEQLTEEPSKSSEESFVEIQDNTPHTSEESYVKIANDKAESFDPLLLLLERADSDLPMLHVAADDTEAAVEASKVYDKLGFDNTLTEPSFENTVENLSCGEETAAAVLEELEHQERMENLQFKMKNAQHGQASQVKSQTSDFAGDEEEIDLCLVEQYDNAFNEFIYRNPRFLVSNPDLVHSLRITKLQKLLDQQDKIENELRNQLESIRSAKLQMETHYHAQLKDAARRKAARDIHWQAHLAEIQHSTKTMEAQLTWDLVVASEHRAKTEAATKEGLSGYGYGRHALATLVPEGPDFDGIRDAIMAPPNLSNQEPLNEEQENDVRQFQMDNAFLNAEVTVLQKKQGYQEIAMKKHAWVESVLVRIDDKTMKKLKSKYQKKTGVQV